MALTDDEKESIRKALEKLPDSVLHLTLETNMKLVRDLQDMNDSLPETQCFLKQRGLSSVRQLDGVGKGELAAHLIRVLQLLRN